ncbi:Xaa-Pro dipeptidase [Amaricoccus macauensis]|uniref:Xaa-Pro dipeptidase n=1 Tax=Amaricoccus macauensis TaxID=57001 RepID=A0A840SPR0_9RHOB|nr:Xaa-Pro peptidase family protein [Amaricoccus macauensis]MBB5221272.1 Xaa-Pro dipeptidase [Amaricoccus macauensis]
MSVEVVEGTGPLVAALPFTEGEYARRLAALRGEMTAAGLDAFVAFGPENINYLTGHDTPAYQYLQASIVTHDGAPVTVLRSIDASNTLLRSWSRRAVIYADHDDPVQTVISSLRELIPPPARIGAEDRAFFVTPRRYAELAAGLAAAGYTLVAAQLVEPLRLVKSAEEIAVIRAAGRITERAMQAAMHCTAEGTSENDIAAAVWAALVSNGGEFPGLPPFIVSGPRSSLGHATWSGRRFEVGDAVNFEIPGVVARYVAPLFRTGSIGDPSPEMLAIEAACLSSLDLVIDAMRPGVRLDEIHRLNVANFARHGFELAHRTGYSVGVNYAPDWGEGDLLSIQAGETRELAEGMVFHLVPGIYLPRRFGLIISETVIVTKDGAEPVMEVPREVFVG